MLDQESLRTFLTVADSGSFTQAAKALNKTSAAIGYRIKNLEQKCGVELLIRTTRAVSLTPAGNHFYKKAQDIAQLTDSLPLELREIDRGIEYNVKIVVNNLLYDATTIAQLIGHISEKFPSTRVQIVKEVYQGVWDALMHGDCDLAIGTPSFYSRDPHITTIPLGEIRWKFVMSPGHPLSISKGPIDDRQLCQFPAVNVQDTAVHINKRNAWLLKGQKEYLVPDMETKVSCHLNGIAVGFLPEHVCSPYLISGRLSSRKIAHSREPSPMSLSWHKDKQGGVINYIVEMFRENSPVLNGIKSRYTDVHPELNKLSQSLNS